MFLPPFPLLSGWNVLAAMLCLLLWALLHPAAAPVGTGTDVWHHGSLVPPLCQAGERGRVNPEGEGGELGEVPEGFPGLGDDRLARSGGRSGEQAGGSGAGTGTAGARDHSAW